MKFEFKYNLSESEKEEMILFYGSVQWVSIEQHPIWAALTEPGKKICFFIASQEDKIQCIALITETKQLMVRSAEIPFGPLSNDSESLIDSVHQIHKYYKKAGFSILSVQLPFTTGATADYIEYKINKVTPAGYKFDRNNWSSTAIGLSSSEEQLFRNISKGHKSNIKKAQKAELKVIDQFSDIQFNEFVAIYIRMYKERGLTLDEEETPAYLGRIRDFLASYHAGKFLLVTDSEEKIIGGVILVYQNKTVRYFKGAADPAIRHLPVLHTAMWEAIKGARTEGFESFDLWGYNHFVDESDQVFLINRFKKGFGGSFIFYPKKMYFIFKPLQSRLLNNIKKVYKKYIKR